MRLSLFLLVFIPFSGWCQKNLDYTDRAYEPQIKTVLCYPNQSSEGNTLFPSATRLDAQNLLLEFDDLQEQRNNYYVRLIHCNFDWTKSSLMDLDFMRDYNEFTINDYSYSINTHVPYIHYRFLIPPVKIPGNYLVIVYRDGNRQNLVLSRRIMIFDPRLNIDRNNDLSGLGNLRSTNQALNFMVSYANMEIMNPLNNIHVTVRQNQRWDNARYDVKPSFIREDISQLEFRFFDMDKTFAGGNEFRFVDFRSLNYPGQNTHTLDRSRKPYELTVSLDRPRTSEAYAQYADLDGNFYVDNRDYPQEPWVSANYLFVNFALQSPQVKGEIYVIGAFNQWARGEENKMVFNQGMYNQRILLKQGFYNYQYWFEGRGDESNLIEGNHFETENTYEVLVYYKSFQPAADQLIGYFVIPVNPR